MAEVFRFRPLDADAIPVDELSAAGRKTIGPRFRLARLLMKTSLIILLLSLAVAPLLLAAGTPTPAATPAATSTPASTPTPATQWPSELKDQKDRVSYSIGLDIGTTLKRQMIEVNPELMNNGIHDGLSGNKPLLNEQQVKETMSVFQKEMMAKQAATKKAAGEKNAAEGTKFLTANKTKEGVKTTASGLQYKVLKEGSGPTPKATDTVKVNYRGTTIDGTEFDSSYKRGEAASFPVNRVIKGWTEALQLMKVGSKYQLFIPADLAYGERGAGADIGPNASLIFDVELLGINPPTPTPAPGSAAKSPGTSEVLTGAGEPGTATSPRKPGPKQTSAAPTTSPKATASPTP